MAVARDLSEIDRKIGQINKSLSTVTDLGKISSGTTRLAGKRDGLVTFMDETNERQVGVLVSGQLFQLVKY
jgi:hypothetical protein